MTATETRKRILTRVELMNLEDYLAAVRSGTKLSRHDAEEFFRIAEKFVKGHRERGEHEIGAEVIYGIARLLR